MFAVNMYAILCAAKHANTTQEVTVDMKYCAAYEITTLAKEKVVMKTNPAYEQVQVNRNIINIIT